MNLTTIRNTSHQGGSVRLLSFLLVLLLIPAAGCRDSAPDDVIVEEETTEAIVFVKTKGEETLNRSWAEGNLFKLSPISPDGVVTPITNFTGASVSDPSVSFDGERILFSMRQQGARDRNIWEIGANGTGLRQVTSGGGHDFDPLYLPDGKIMFTSSRHGQMDEYNHSPAEKLYTCEADGTNLQRVSSNMSDDFDPTSDTFVLHLKEAGYQTGLVGLGLYLLFVVCHFFHSFSLLRHDDYVSTDQGILRLGLVVLSTAHVYFLAYSIEMNFATWTLIGLAISVACSDPAAETADVGGAPLTGTSDPGPKRLGTHLTR